MWILNPKNQKKNLSIQLRNSRLLTSPHQVNNVLPQRSNNPNPSHLNLNPNVSPLCKANPKSHKHTNNPSPSEVSYPRKLNVTQHQLLVSLNPKTLGFRMINNIKGKRAVDTAITCMVQVDKGSSILPNGSIIIIINNTVCLHLPQSHRLLNPDLLLRVLRRLMPIHKPPQANSVDPPQPHQRIRLPLLHPQHTLNNPIIHNIIPT